MGTKEIDPCPGYDKCPNFKANFTTNADHIRSMTDEELAEWVTSGTNSITTICDIICPHGCNAIPDFEKSANMRCKEIVMKRLKQPHKENEE